MHVLAARNEATLLRMTEYPIKSAEIERLSSSHRHHPTFFRKTAPRGGTVTFTENGLPWEGES